MSNILVLIAYASSKDADKDPDEPEHLQVLHTQPTCMEIMEGSYQNLDLPCPTKG